jgi:predicted metal-binding membrane protein
MALSEIRSSSVHLDRAVEGLLRRDRFAVIGALIVLTSLAWGYLVVLVGEMGMTLTGGMEQMQSMMALRPWTALDAIFMFLMWAVMMVGMMTPSASPMILLYAMVSRKRAKVDSPLISTAAFFAGYLAVWSAFSAAATGAQWGLERAALLSPMMTSTSAIFAGIVLMAAGLYQWTSYKNACLTRCREPVWFLSRIWRDGTGGAFRMGFVHGAFCLGCCWVLMALLFVGGVMNLLTVAAITVFVIVEKVVPFGRGIGRAAAIGLVALGVFMVVVGNGHY